MSLTIVCGVQINAFRELLKDPDTKMELERLDRQTGYANNESIKEINKAFSTPERIKLDEKVNNYANYINNKGYGVLETYDFALKYARDIFGNNIKIENIYDEEQIITGIYINTENGVIGLIKANDEPMQIIKHGG